MVTALKCDACGAELPEFINYLEKRTIKNVCQVCGGSFKGVFTKVCSDCGAKKDF